MPPPSVSEVLSIPTRWGGVTNGANSMADMLAQRQTQGQGLQLEQAKQLANAQAMSMAYTGRRNPNIDAMLSQNPFGKFIMPQGWQPQGAGSPQPGNNIMSSVLMGNSPASAMFGAGGNVSPIGMGMPGAMPTEQGQQTQGQGGGSANFSPFNPVSSGPVATSATSEFQPYIGMVPKSITTQNPSGESVVSQAKAQGEANVAPTKEFSTKMAGSQALAQENLVRDNTQMMSVFQTLKNLHDIHSTLAKSNLAGTDLGNLAQNNLGHVGTFAAMLGQNPANVQRSIVSPENQNLLGQFTAGRNEGITRAIQPLQNQVDKVGSSRISDTLLHMTEGEYGKLDDTQDQFDGKTLGTAKTLYRITLASQRYAEMLKAKGISLDSTSKDFDADKIAKDIYDSAKAIELTPEQNKQFNEYANNIIGTNGLDYSNGVPKNSNFNPLDKAKPKQKQSSSLGVSADQEKIARQVWAQAKGSTLEEKTKNARVIAKTLGYKI